MSSKKPEDKEGIKNKRKLKLTELSEEQQKLQDGFIMYEKKRGMKNMEQKVLNLSRFFAYVNSMAVDIVGLTGKGAQEFQTYLSTLENDDGNPYYATLTIKSIISMTTRFYNYLKAAGRIHTNPFLGIKRIKTGKKLPASIVREQKMNDILEELSRFWEQKQVRERRMYYKAHVMSELMYATGLRIGEVLKLQSDDIDFMGKTITVHHGKKEKERIAYLNDYAAQVLYIYIHEMREVINKNKRSPFIFGVENITTITPSFHRRLKKICTKHGVKQFTSHGFRHTLGFHLLRRGCDMRYIQLILGHEDMNTTTIYTKVDKADLRTEIDNYHPRQLRSGYGKS